MRVAPNIYLVASGVQGCSLTGDLDCNCWLVDAGQDLVLFDTGAGLDVDRIFAVLREDGLSPDRLTHVFLTHAHADHSGGAAEIKQRTGCKLLCSAPTVELLGKGEDAFSLAAARKAGVYPPDYVYRRPAPDIALSSNQTTNIGNCRITAIPTPGHSLDHTAFLVEQPDRAALVTGDAMMHSGRIIYQATYDFDVGHSAESIRRLATFNFDLLLPGHGLFVRTDGRRHVEAAITHMSQLKTPRAVDFIPL
ncbi:MBL fold metallo-hydrolase [Methylocapsa sp. S129]|uniref:MBL fold metallo-hydrolase n=1 Tax=Methylocapsa sp. S129 TaxID=1641869 RepID=UPI00131E5AC1|nr:MBL fold metallo-hydrolase [Methylocapsa sp. S129]